MKVTAEMRKIRKLPQVKYTEKAEKLGRGKGTVIKYKKKNRFLEQIEKKIDNDLLAVF